MTAILPLRPRTGRSHRHRGVSNERSRPPAEAPEDDVLADRPDDGGFFDSAICIGAGGVTDLLLRIGSTRPHDIDERIVAAVVAGVDHDDPTLSGPESVGVELEWFSPRRHRWWWTKMVVVDDRFGAVLLLVDVVAPALSSLVIRVDVVVADTGSDIRAARGDRWRKAVARAVNVTARCGMSGALENPNLT